MLSLVLAFAQENPLTTFFFMVFVLLSMVIVSVTVSELQIHQKEGTPFPVVMLAVIGGISVVGTSITGVIYLMDLLTRIQNS